MGLGLVSISLNYYYHFSLNRKKMMSKYLELVKQNKEIKRNKIKQYFLGNKF